MLLIALICVRLLFSFVNVDEPIPVPIQVDRRVLAMNEECPSGLFCARTVEHNFSHWLNVHNFPVIAIGFIPNIQWEWFGWTRRACVDYWTTCNGFEAKYYMGLCSELADPLFCRLGLFTFIFQRDFPVV